MKKKLIYLLIFVYIIRDPLKKLGLGSGRLGLGFTPSWLYMFMLICVSDLSKRIKK